MRKKFTRILVMLVVIVATSVQAFGQIGPVVIVPFEEGGIWYLRTGSTTSTVTVVSGPNGSSKYTGVVDIPAKVTHEGEEYNVIAIDYQAFLYCNDLISVKIPEGVTTIVEDAFYGCIYEA